MTNNQRFSISIIIPSCNRPNELNRLINSLYNSFQYTKKDIETEIIISDDSNNYLSKNLINKSFPMVTWIKGPQNGPGANRNNGARIATKEWLLFIDDDCYVNEDFIKSYSSIMQKNLCNVIEGKILCPDKKNSIFARQPDNNQGGVLASGNFAIKKSLFVEMNGFDEDFKIMEDIEFAARLKSMGESFIFCENGIAYHPSQTKSIFFYYYWIFHFKWHILLEYKCNKKDLNQLFIISASITICDHLIHLLRISLHLFKKYDKDRWIMFTFERMLAWVSLPLSIPHLIYWDFIFRKRIKNNYDNYNHSNAK